MSILPVFFWQRNQDIEPELH